MSRIAWPNKDVGAFRVAAGRRPALRNFQVEAPPCSQGSNVNESRHAKSGTTSSQSMDCLIFSQKPVKASQAILHAGPDGQGQDVPIVRSSAFETSWRMSCFEIRHYGSRTQDQTFGHGFPHRVLRPNGFDPFRLTP